MKTSSRFLPFVVSLVLLATSLMLTLPREAQALCCGFSSIEDFYFDEAKTEYAGRCVDNTCTGSYYCTGTQTEYSSHSFVCCMQCPRP